MTESGTPPPRGHYTPIVPAAGRPASDGPIPIERFGYMRDAGKDLIEFESVARGGGHQRPLEPFQALHPAGIVRGETHTSLLPRALAGGSGASLPNVVVREDREPPRRSSASSAPPVLSIPAADDDFVVGGPEPSDWVRLADARSAPTEPSMRRRVHGEASVSPDAPTPIEPNAERRRERLRNVVALSLGGFVALIGLSSLLVTSLVSRDGRQLAPREVGAERNRPAAPVRAIEAARAESQQDAIPPPPGQQLQTEEIAVVQVEPPRAVARSARAEPAHAPPARRAAAGASRAENADNLFGKPMAPASSPATTKPPRVGRVRDGLAHSSVSSGSEASIPRASSASSPQPKKRLWFPPE